MNAIGSRHRHESRPRTGAGNGSRVVALILLICISAPARSSNGLNAPGNGTVQLGMAGAGTAMAEDASATCAIRRLGPGCRTAGASIWASQFLMADSGPANLGAMRPSDCWISHPLNQRP